MLEAMSPYNGPPDVEHLLTVICDCDDVMFARGVLSRTFEVEPNSQDVSFETSDCELGKYWSHSNERCELCSECGERQYIRAKCSQYGDTVCDYCLTAFPRKNADFRRKCSQLVDAERVFENERDLNTRIGARIIGADKPEHTFWNFEESIRQRMTDDSDEEFDLEVETHKPALQALIGSHLGRVLVRCAFFALVFFTFYLLIRSFINRNKHNGVLITSIPTPRFTDEQNQVIKKSAEELEKIISKRCYDQRKPRPEFV
ncbi:hypothetical protein Tcan_07571 [Toxocara canis]|uniref:TNFR-Cys domain-containing protein n=2 Tax=Toxocara canis TaxID=6265 RepID=A0A0B2V8S4_TOXCA|nr:hypothetical protein Tcan_07571 [Toxocara canis]VDM40544.1 unnamed protein product [Toxocara canis]